MQNITNKRRTNINIKSGNLLFCSIIILSLLLNFSTLCYAESKTKVVAITEIVAHPSLEQAKLGIIDELRQAGYEDGKNLKIIEQNAQGSVANAALIAKNFVSMNPDAIVAISTPSAQSALNATHGTNIPLIISSVTDPVAAGLVKTLSVPEPNITGAIDFPLIKEEIEFIKQLVPNIKTLGLLYNPGEANSVKTIELIKAELNGEIVAIESAATSSNHIATAMTNLIGKVDAVYIPSDNTIFSGMAKVVQIARHSKLPLFSSDPDSVKQGVLGCVGYTQYAVGRMAGKLLVKVLNGQKLLKIQNPDKVEVFINETTAKILGLSIPDTILGIKVSKVE